ncbi:hypothetical protein M758_3G006600 [Ceratodon purpureus]|uniref:Secreted protein n=1 Tax=Ceratodon purpureus TaxID=3225 RepID=A0A8T0IFU9_CERPU|nr:hypothetical protein KC19_3G008600 [Ceratodon purpureus]KAG0621269.1 hypothetical protein M758_3G006600 [Ceratodon purpureus]
MWSLQLSRALFRIVALLPFLGAESLNYMSKFLAIPSQDYQDIVRDCMCVAHGAGVSSSGHIVITEWTSFIICA